MGVTPCKPKVQALLYDVNYLVETLWRKKQQRVSTNCAKSK